MVVTNLLKYNTVQQGFFLLRNTSCATPSTQQLLKQARVVLGAFDGRPLARAPSRTPPPSLTSQVLKEEGRWWKLDDRIELPVAPLGELMTHVIDVRSF